MLGILCRRPVSLVILGTGHDLSAIAKEGVQVIRVTVRAIGGPAKAVTRA